MNLEKKLAKSEKGSVTKRSYTIARPDIEEDSPENIKEPKLISLPDAKPEEKQKEASNRIDLIDFKYDGYMKVGDFEIVWITRGADRISASKGSIIKDNIVIEEIHESYLVIEDRDNNIRQSIPFTDVNDANRLTAGYIKSNVMPRDQANPKLSNTYVQPQRPVIQNRNRKIASSAEGLTDINTHQDQIYDTPPQIPLDDAPPMPW